MPEKYAFFDSVSGDREYFAKDFTDYFADLISSGVSAAGDYLRVAVSGGMTVTVSPGRAWLNGRFYQLTAPMSISVPIGGTYGRIDRVIIRLDSAERKIGIKLLKGEETAAPVVPSIVRNDDYYDICIAQIHIAPGAISLTNADVEDTRTDNAVCGLVRCLVDHFSYQPLDDVPRLLWLYTVFPSLLNAEERAIVESTPELFELWTKSKMFETLHRPVLKRKTFTSPSTFTATVDGTYFVRVQASGGQGTAAEGSITIGGGGGYGEKTVSLKKGDTIICSVSTAANQNASFGSYITAYAGTVANVGTFGMASAKGDDCVGGEINITGGTALFSSGPLSATMGLGHLSTSTGKNFAATEGYGGGGATESFAVYPAGGGIISVEWIEYVQQELPANATIRTQIIPVTGNVSAVPTGASVGDQFLNAGTGTFTIAGMSAAIGDLIKITKLSPLEGVFNGNIRGPTGTQGTQGIQGNSGGVIAPISGFFTMHVDNEGNLFALTADDGVNPIKYDAMTGDLYYVIL